jgi:hypothetical protein
MPRTKNQLQRSTVSLIVNLSQTIRDDSHAAFVAVVSDPIIDCLHANETVGHAIKNWLIANWQQVRRSERRPILRDLCRAGYFPAASSDSTMRRKCITIDGQKYDLSQLTSNGDTE